MAPSSENHFCASQPTYFDKKQKSSYFKRIAVCYIEFRAHGSRCVGQLFEVDVSFAGIIDATDKSGGCPCCSDPLAAVKSALSTVAALRTLPGEAANAPALRGALADVKARGAKLLAAVASPPGAVDDLDDLLARFDESVASFEAECRFWPAGGDVARHLSDLAQAFRTLGEAVRDMTDRSPRRWSQKGKATPKSGPFVCAQTFS